MAGYLKPYKTYVFKDKDPAIDMVRTASQDDGRAEAEIAAMAGVSRSTPAGWFRGKVRRPQHATLEAYARACGKSFVLVNYTPPHRSNGKRS